MIVLTFSDGRSEISNITISYRHVIRLPESIGSLSSLTTLRVYNSRLGLLPESIGNLSSLVDLNISHNQLTHLPDSIGNLSSLTNLHDRIPLRWWFGFSRSYEDGRAGEEGRTRHVLCEIEFEERNPRNWYSDAPLSDWMGITLHPGIMLIDS